MLCKALKSVKMRLILLLPIRGYTLWERLSKRIEPPPPSVPMVWGGLP